MPRLTWFFGIVLLIGSIVGASWAYNQSSAGGGSVKDSAKISNQGPPIVMMLGRVDGENGFTPLAPLQQGRVLKVVEKGTKVSKDEPILWLDDTLAELKVKEAEQDMEAARAQHKQARTGPQIRERKMDQQTAAIEAAKHKRESIKKDFDQKIANFKTIGNVNKDLLDSLEQSLKQMDSLIVAEQAKLEEIKLANPDLDIERAKADYEAKRVRHEEAKWVKEQCVLKAPSDGTVLRVNVNKGSILSTAEKVPPIEFLPEGPLMVRGEIIQEFANRVKEGMEVTVEDDTYKGPEWKGRVRWVSPWMTQKSKLIIEPFMTNDYLIMECLVEITSKDERYPLRYGQRVKIKVNGETK